MKLLNAPSQLILEEPTIITLKITNMTPKQYNLKLYIDELETQTIGIYAISIQVKQLTNNFLRNIVC